MARTDVDNSENSILYELLVYSDWVQDFDNSFQRNTHNSSNADLSYFGAWKFFKNAKPDSKRTTQTEYPWQLAVSQDGKVLAILQESLLEIRTAKDDYATVVGKASMPPDQFPQLRKLAWSPDNTFLAVARENGSVNLYTLLGCNVAYIPPVKSSNTSLQSVVGLQFLQPKFKSVKWSNELIVALSDGNLRSILLSPLDGCEPEENMKFSFESVYPEGITLVTYNANHHILVVAGPCDAPCHGITIWRICSDHPYLRIVFDTPISSSNPRSLLRFLPGFSVQRNPCTITKMKISPNGNMLACLHDNGTISLWHFPGIRELRRWTLVQQPQHHKCNVQSSDVVKSEHYFYPIDICWWSNSALVVARRSGAVSVCSVVTLNNLLGDSPEYLAGPPQISSIHGDRSGVIALECEITCNYRNRRLEEHEMGSESESETSVLQASIQAALYSFTDIESFQPKRKSPKIIQRTYRLIALKPTTPEELYNRKINNEEYEEALSLAKTYNLDCDLVYQRQWRTSNVSVSSIYNYLDKVSKTLWVANECVERVPDSAEAALELLQFGLRLTDLDEEIRHESGQKQLIKFRKQLFLFLDNLTIYEKIIGSPDKYDSTEYGSFRRKPAIVSTVTYARQENWQAVAILFTYKGKETLQHWLPILSSFPETLMPVEYKSLFPEILWNEVIPWETRTLRNKDWCEEDPFRMELYDEDESSEFLYESDPSLREFKTLQLSPKIVEEWCRRRTYTIEESTGLVEYALSFVKIARERNVQNLDRLYYDLLTLESLVYIVQDEDIKFSKLETLSHTEQAKLLLSKTKSDTFVDDLKNLLIPFAIRCEQQGCDNRFSLLRSLLLDFSQDGLEFPLLLLKHLKEEASSPLKMAVTESITLALDCLYACNKTDQLENSFLILECLPERSLSSGEEEDKLHDRVDVLEKHLEICEILECYGISESVRFVLENENNETVGKQLMKDMTKNFKMESVDFSKLLPDLQELQSRMFPSIDPNFCYELFALTQMTCECEEIIQSAEDVMECRKGESGKIIPFEKSIELVLEAAKIHFEKATSGDEVYIKLSQTCLKLINEPHPKIHEELDLIESIQLLGDFDVRLLPLQVKICPDRMKLIEACLKAKPKAYRSCQRLLQLAQTLRICGEDRQKREGQVLTLIAEYALSCCDYQYCSEVCSRLVSRNYGSGWRTVCLLAQCSDFENVKLKKDLLAFAISHCPIDSVEKLIEERIELTAPIFPHSVSRISSKT